MRVLLVPGFTQTAGSWAGVVAEVGRSSPCRALEVPDGLDLHATLQALADAGGAGCWAGYSMGGRLCLALALARPELVTRLVLVSASPGIADAAERAARRHADEGLAREVERDGVATFLERWLALPLFATLPADAPGRDARLADPAAVAHQLRTLGQGVQPPVWARLSELRMPVLLVAGEHDAKYVDIARRAAAAIGAAARVAVVAGAGHAVPLERPRELAHLIVAFVAA